MQFYYADGAQQKGPLPIDQLRSVGLTPETLVWHEGMNEWAPAGQVPELADLLRPKAAVPREPDGPPVWQQPSVPPVVADRFTPPVAGSTVPPGAQPLGYVAPWAGGGAFVPGPQPVPGHGLSVASLVLGILSLVTGLLALCMWWASVPMAVVTVVLGHMGQSAFKRATGRRNGMATAGLVCGYVAIALNAVIWMAVLAYFQTAQQQQQQMQQRQTQQRSGW